MYVQNVTRGLHEPVFSGNTCLIMQEKKQHACPECDKRFTRAGTLKDHMLINSGENTSCMSRM